MDWKDRSWLKDTAAIEQTFPNFTGALSSQPSLEPAVKAMAKMMDGAEKDSIMFRGMFNIAGKYLYDPNSPLRNDELFIPILEKYIASPEVKEIDKVRPRFQLEMLKKTGQEPWQLILFTLPLREKPA